MVAADPSAAEHAALAAAVAAARAKAAVLAEAAGVALGAVTRIEEEASYGDAPLPVLRAMSAEATDTPTEVVAGELTVSRRIRAWFLLG